MNLVGYTATALSRNDIEDTPTNKNVVDFAIVELKDLQGNLVVMYDDSEGANPETQKTCDTNGQVTFFAEIGDYDLEINGKAQRINLAANIADYIKLGTGESVQEFADSFALKIFQSPTDGGLTEIQTRTVNANEVYEVRKTSDNSLATIYSDADGVTEIVQNGTDNKSGSDGVVEFYVNAGDYYVEVGSSLRNFITENYSIEGLDSISSLLGINNPSDTLRLSVKNYHSVGDGGGGFFYYDANCPKSMHNGGTVIDNSRTYPSDLNSESQLKEWFEYSDKVGLGCFIRLDPAFEVESFGAIPNDSSKGLLNYYAIKTTVQSAVDVRYKRILSTGADDLWSNGKVIFGVGIYTISKNNPLRPDLSKIPNLYNSKRRGLSFEGAGQEQSILYNDGSSGADFHFWENYDDALGTDGRKIYGFDNVQFSSMSFHGPDPDSFLKTTRATKARPTGQKVNVIGVFATGWEKEFSFHEVGFAGIDKVSVISGFANGDKFVFYRCMFAPIREAVLSCTNDQSIGHSFTDCNYVLYGDFFNIGEGGGGGSTVSGGSCVIYPNFDDDGLPSAIQPDKALVRLTTNIKNSSSRGSYYNFIGVSFEFYGSHSKDVIINSALNAGSCSVKFDKCDWYTVVDWTRSGIVPASVAYDATIINGDIYASVIYNLCLLSKYREFSVTNTRKSTLYAQTPILSFLGCELLWVAVSTDTIDRLLADKISVTGGLRLQIANCFNASSNQNYNSQLSASTEICRDIGIVGTSLNSKTIETDIKPIGATIGNGTTTVNKVLIPKKSVVLGVSVHREATTSPSEYTARITNGKLGVDKIIFAEWTQAENVLLSETKVLLVENHGGMLGFECSAGNLEGGSSFATVKYK